MNNNLKCNNKATCDCYQIKDLSIVPFDIDNKTIRRAFSFLLHKAPNIESLHSGYIELNKHDDLFRRMMDNRHFDYERICAFNAVIENKLKKAKLDGELICLKCKRYWNKK